MPFTEIDLSYNNLTARAGVILGDALATHGLLTYIKLTGCNVEVEGVQRICETLVMNRSLRALDIGYLTEAGLRVVSKYLSRAVHLQSLAFQEMPRTKWGSEVKELFITTLKKAKLLEVTITTDNTEDHADFLGEVQRLAGINRADFIEEEQNRDALLMAEASTYCTNLLYE
mmetsp:Transcript_15797/g.28889  ORF Transcript_15797/g.28889 Transcript_15797/m.28889 type:complete len:172 (+) Transcript_15797:243-758(+)